MNRRMASLAVFTIAVIVLIQGCGPSEPKYHDISGTVTFDGKPVPMGVIHFEPKSKGRAGFANILNGKFDTAEQGTGVLGGSYNIRINGFDGKKGDDAPFGAAIFPEYTDSKELKAEKQTLDIDVKKKK